MLVWSEPLLVVRLLLLLLLLSIPNASEIDGNDCLVVWPTIESFSSPLALLESGGVPSSLLAALARCVSDRELWL